MLQLYMSFLVIREKVRTNGSEDESYLLSYVYLMIQKTIKRRCVKNDMLSRDIQASICNDRMNILGKSRYGDEYWRDIQFG